MTERSPISPRIQARRANQTRGVRCQECGAVLCPTCAIKVDLAAYCRWCAVTTPLLVLTA